MAIATRWQNLSIKNLLTPVVGAALAAWVTTLTSPVQALTFITERATLAGNDRIDWSSLGKVFNPFSPNPTDFLPNSFSAMSQKGLGLSVDIPVPSNSQISPPFVFLTGIPPRGIPTNFANGDFILFTGVASGSFPAVGNPGPLSISFKTPVLGAGTQIAVDDTENFTAFVSAFDSANNLLGTFSISGTGAEALNNSAVFVGVRSDIPNISRLVFSSSQPNRALGINAVSIATVSEPTAAFAVMLVGVMGASFAIKRQV
ncbi:hypothetical protein NUACC21_74510 [Scytonema sp. NUACC21]